MLLRRFLRRVHRWLSLSLGLLFLLLSLSGGVLVFAHPLDRWLNPHLFQRTGDRDIGFNAAYAAVQSAYPNQRVTMLWSPHRHGVYEAVLQGKPATVVYIDPASGDLLGSRRTADSLVGWLTELHVTLFAGSVGEWIVGSLGMLLFIVLVTGAILWWPTWRRIALGFRVRVRKGWFAALYDLHKLTGILTLPLVAMIALSGFFLTFHTVAMVVVHALTLSQPLEYPRGEALRCSPTSSGKLSPEQWQQIAEQAVPGGVAMYLAFPAQDDLAAQVRLQTPNSPHPSGFARVWLDPYTGRVLHKHDPSEFTTGNHLYAKWMFPLHIGSYGGFPTRLIHAGISLAPAFLTITGVWMWWYRHQLKKQGRASQPE